jgi:hypothetical protein
MVISFGNNPGEKPEVMKTGGERLADNLRVGNPLPRLPEYEVQNQRGQEVLYHRIGPALVEIYRAPEGKIISTMTHEQLKEFAKNFPEPNL